jgi:RNA polymerase sigma-70 factor (ECF subfamily)
MNQPPTPDIQHQIDRLYRTDSRRVFATLIRLLGDFDLAEEATHEAFTSAVEQWPRDGVPANPYAWLVSTGRFRGIDALRRQTRSDATLAELAAGNQWATLANLTRASTKRLERDSISPNSLFFGEDQ